MLLSAVSVLVVAQSSSEIPEGLMNNPVYVLHLVGVSGTNIQHFYTLLFGTNMQFNTATHPFSSRVIHTIS